MRRHLVTGAAGLLGSHVVMLLAEQGAIEVHCAVRSNEAKQRLVAKLEKEGVSTDKIVFHTVDLQDYAEVRAMIDEVSPEVVYHTAARVALDTDTVAEGEMMVSSNVDMTHFLTDAMIEHKAARGTDPLLVHVSSIAALGTQDPRGIIDENTPFTDISHASPYARSKFLSQNDVQRASKLGLRTVTVCPSVIIGLNGGRGKMLQLFQSIKSGVPFYTYGSMGYVDVRDVAHAMVLLAEKVQKEGENGEIYCLNGANLTFREFITIFGVPFARQVPKIGVSRGVLTAIGRAVSVWCKITHTKPLMGANTVRYLNEKAAYDGSKILKALGGEFSYTPIEETAAYVAKNIDK